jgi:hypothetical protein
LPASWQEAFEFSDPNFHLGGRHMFSEFRLAHPSSKGGATIPGISMAGKASVPMAGDGKDSATVWPSTLRVRPQLRIVPGFVGLAQWQVGFSAATDDRAQIEPGRKSTRLAIWRKIWERLVY